MAKSVLHELDQLRSLLDQPPRPAAQLHYRSYSPSKAYSPEQHDYGGRPDSIGSYGSALHTAEKGVSRLGRAIEAAEEEVEAALQRTSEVHRAQLRQKDAEIGELQRVAVAKERAIDGLRDSMAAAKKGYEGKLRQMESALSSRDAQLSSLQAEVLALRSERDNLEARLSKGLGQLERTEAELSARSSALGTSLRLKDEEAAQALAAYHREHKEKQLLVLEVGELRRELDALDEELASARQEAASATDRWQGVCEARRDLEVQLDKQRAQYDFLRESKEVEVEELKRRLIAERGVRKACEKWLKAELKSREEMETLLVAVRDVTMGAAARDASPSKVQQVEALINSMQANAASHAASRAAASAVADSTTTSAAAERYKREFAEMKRALDADSDRLKQELAAARQQLGQRLKR